MRNKYFVHDGLASMLLIFSFGLFFFFVLTIVQIENGFELGTNYSKQEKYKSAITYQYTYDSGKNVDIDLKLNTERLEISKGNLIIENFRYPLGDENTQLAMDIVLKQNEPLVEELKNGRFPLESEIRNHRKCIVIGNDLVSQIQKEERKQVIYIDGIKYEVIGILKDKGDNKTDDSIIVFYDCLAEQSKKKINQLLGKNGKIDFTVLYGSNSSECEENVVIENWLSQIIDKEYYKTNIEKLDEEEEDAYNFSAVLEACNKLVISVLLLFCGCTCIVVSDMWMKRRRREIIIRKSCGSGIFQIIGILLVEILILILMSLLIDVFIIIVLKLLNGKWKISQMINFNKVVKIVIAFVFVIMIRPICFVIKVKPANGIKTM